MPATIWAWCIAFQRREEDAIRMFREQIAISPYDTRTSDLAISAGEAEGYWKEAAAEEALAVGSYAERIRQSGRAWGPTRSRADARRMRARATPRRSIWFTTP